MDIDTWLRGIGLERYTEAFRAHDIGERTLPKLTSEDLREIGVSSVGHRRLLLEAIAELRSRITAAEVRRITASSKSLALAVQGRAERRQLTVMFVDLVGSTALSTQLDPEELHGVLRRYQETVAEAVTHFGGYIAKFMGDGVLAYFGWPQAHEDDAERAVRAGLSIVDSVRSLRTPVDQSLATRVGIATGLVVVGDILGEGAAREETVVGETPNLAARLQQLAEPDTVVVAESTKRLLGVAFELRALEPRPLKGLGQAVPAFRLIAEHTVQSRFEARQHGVPLPLIGREQELALLGARWRLAGSGRGQAVLLVGEPGIGKSRIVKAFVDSLTGELTVVRYQCSPYHVDSPLWPFIEQLRFAAGFAPDDDDPARLRKLEKLFGSGANDSADAALLMTLLLRIEPAARHPVLDLSSQQRRALTLAALVSQLEGLAAGQPALIIIEDIHWIDPTSLELVEDVLDRIAGWQALAVLTSRPGDQPAIASRSHLAHRTLGRLDRETSAIIIREVGGKPLPPDIEDAIACRADGVPLFVEELTRAVLESGQLREAETGWERSGVLPPGDIPSSLQDSLMARLDRLGPAKEIAQVAACIGREFDRHLLSTLTAQPKRNLDNALHRLVVSELVIRRGGAVKDAYAFKHALIQDAAYASMLKSQRKQIHAAVVDALDRHFPEVGTTQPEIVARHCELAGRLQRAVQFWQRAGELAAARSATAEAAAHLEHAVRCLEMQPSTRENQLRELHLQASLGPALIHVKGYAARETGRAWERARELCRELDLSDRIGPVLFGQYVFHYVRSEFDLARAAAQELLDFGHEHDDEAARLVGIRNLGVIGLSTGEFAAGRRCLQVALDGLGRLDAPSLTHAYGQDLHATGLLWLAKILLIQGFPEQALGAGQEGLRRSEALGHPNTRAFTLCHAAKLAALIRDALTTLNLANATEELAAEQGYAQWQSEAWVFRGWARAELGEPEVGLAELDRGANAYQASGAIHWRSTHLGLRGRILTLLSRLKEAREVLGEAFGLAQSTGEHWFEAEIQRLTGEVLVQVGEATGAEMTFLRALDLARSQGARVWELRAANSLARLWAVSGKEPQARDLLRSIHERSVDAGMVDLKEATALLDKLT